jgi:hypothetical protein
MTRNEVIAEMRKKALAITGSNSENWTRDAENEIWTMAIDFNSSHDDSEEIFMCEHCDDNETVDGFYIEDDYYLVEA